MDHPITKRPNGPDDNICRWVFCISIVIALVGVCAGQYLLVAKKNEGAAGILCGIGAIAFLAAMVTSKRIIPRDGAKGADRTNSRDLSPMFSYTIAAAFTAITCFLVNVPGMDIPSLALWFASLALVLVTALPKGAASTLIAEARKGLRRDAILNPELAAVGALVVVGALLRLYDLEGFPSGVHGDEAEHALIALSILDGKGLNPFGTAFLGDRALYFYLEAPFLAAFGRTIPGMRTFSAITGTITLPVFYLFARQLFGKRIALLSLALLTGASIHIHYSRFAGHVSHTILLACISIYALRNGQAKGHPFWWLLSGIAGSSSIYFAFGGAAILLTLASYLVYLLIFHNNQWRSWLRGGVLIGIGCLITLVPVAAYMVGRNDHYTEHLAGRLIFNNWGHVTGVYKTTSFADIIWEQVKTNFLAFFARPDGGPFFAFANTPILAPLLGPCFVLGLLLLCWQLRSSKMVLLLLWFIPVYSIGGVLTIDSPQSHRLIIAIVPAILISALCLDWLIDNGIKLLGVGKAWNVIIPVALVPIVVGISDNVNYFGPAAASKPWEDTTTQGRYAASLGSQFRVYGVGAPHIYINHGVTRFLAPDVVADDIINPAADLPVLAKGNYNMAFLVYPHVSFYLPLLQSVYPEGRSEEIKGKDNHTVFTSFKVPTAAVSNSQGLLARYGTTTRIEVDPGSIGGGATSYPTTVVLSGSLYVERAGRYLIRAEGATASIAIDGSFIGTGETRHLTRGWHQLDVQGEMETERSRLALKWGQPGQQLAPIPRDNLDVRPLRGGLRCQIVTEGGAAVERWDRTIGFRDLSGLWDIRQPVEATWKGTLTVDIPGEYHFVLNSTDPAEVTIAGRQVINLPEGTTSFKSTSSTVQLPAGSHPFMMRYRSTRSPGSLELFWSSPSGQTTIIPAEAFGPPILIQ